MRNGTFSFRTAIVIHETVGTVPSNTLNLNVHVPDAPGVPGAPDVPELLISPGELVLVQPKPCKIHLTAPSHRSDHSRFQTA